MHKKIEQALKMSFIEILFFITYFSKNLNAININDAFARMCVNSRPFFSFNI